ncbi:MAG TPA: efflux RND transporter periplasmic adaptor subunit [Chitinophagaceae bacterium]
MMAKEFYKMRWIYMVMASIIFLDACTNQTKKVDEHIHAAKEIYTCPMHPQIIRDKPGDCPICGMKLVKKETNTKTVAEVGLSTLLKPANQYVVSSIPVTTMQPDIAQIEIEALGVTAYDTRYIGNISAKVSGRIERLYVRSTFQDVMKGQKVMDIYSPELLTAEQNLLFFLKNDASNFSLINAAKQKLLLLGVSPGQLQQIIKSGKPSYTISVYSNYSGHLHDIDKMESTEKNNAIISSELKIKEGMYVQKEQTVFSVYDPHRLWALLDIFPGQEALVKVGDVVRIIPETAPDKYFSARVNFIEPFFRSGSKTVTARVYFDNSKLNLAVGSQVRAVVYGKSQVANWLTKEAVVSLGKDKIVFLKSAGGFQTHVVQTGLTDNNRIQIISGLSATDSVAANAQFLMDAESIIKTK